MSEKNRLAAKREMWGDIDLGVQKVKAAEAARQAAAAPPPATTASTPAMSAEQEAKAQRVVIKQFQDEWGKIDRRFFDITPMGAVANAEGMTAHTKSTALQNAYNTTLNYFAGIAGDEYLGSYIMAQGLGNTQQRQSTLGALMQIIQGGTLAEPQTTYGNMPVRAVTPDQRMSPELFGQVVMAPGKFKDLNLTQQTEFIAQAQKVVDEYGKRGQQADAMKRALAAVATGDMHNVLNDAEVDDLHKAVSQLRQGNADLAVAGPGFTADAGLAKATQGTEGAVFTFDEDWAKAHPAKAAAESYYLQQRFPNAQIKYGTDGIVGEIFGALGKPIDVIATPFSTLITQSTRAVRHVFDHGDVDELKAELTKQQQALARAPYSERGAIMNTIDNLNDRIGVITGESLQGDATRSLMDRSLNSEESNLGFARNMVEGTGLLPGDGGYEVAVGASMLVGGVVFDPLTYVTGGLEGLAAARRIPKVVGAVDSAYTTRSLVARWVYNRMALNPEQFLEKTGMAADLGRIAAATTNVNDYKAFLRNLIKDDLAVSSLAAAGDNVDDISSTLHLFLSGPVKGQDITALTNRASQLADRLNEFERLEKHAASVRAVAKGGTSELARIEDEMAHLYESGQAAGPRFDELTARHADLSAAIEPSGMNVVNAAIQDVALEGDNAIVELERGFINAENERFKAAFTAGQTEYVRDYREGKVYVVKDMDDEIDGVLPGTRYYYVENGEARGFRSVDPDGEVGTAVAEGYEGKGIARILHDTHWDDVGVGDDPAKMAEQIAAQSVFSPGGAALNRAASRDRLNGLMGVGTRLDELRSTAKADAAEAIRIKSLLKGKTDTVMPMDFGTLRDLRKSGNKWLRAVGETMDDLGEFPRNAPSLYATQAHQIMRGMRKVFQASGTEGADAVRGWLRRAVWLPGVNLPPDALVNALDRSRDALIGVGRLLGASDETIGRHMGMWSDLVAANDRQASYRWFSKYWAAVIEDSDKLSGMGKADLSRLWDSSFDQWGSDFVRLSKPGEVVNNEPLMYKLIVDPITGETHKAAQPVFSADALSHGIFLPDLTEIMHVLHPRATAAIVGPKATKVTGVWKQAILLGKMPFALPMRIVGELSLARMSAYNLAGLSPFGVLDYIRSIRGRGKFAEFADVDEAFALGNILEDYETEGRIFNQLGGAGLLEPFEGENYFRALSGRLEYLAKSPETRYIMRAATPEELVALVNAPDAPAAIRHAAGQWAQMEGGLDANAAKAWKYLHENVTGSGGFAEEVKRALASGAFGDGTQAGTLPFARRIQEEVKKGNYYLSMGPVHAKYGQGLYTGRTVRTAKTGFGELIQKVFRAGYGKPEAYFGRLPAYRQVATKYKSRLVAMGYEPDVAHKIASAAAQEDIAEMFFKIGAHTSGEYMVQNIAPFFPAWREVTSTWAVKLPSRIGGGAMGWPVGAAYLAQRGRVLLDSLTEMGVVEEGPDGRKRVHIPILSPVIGGILEAITPGSQEYGDYDFSFGSMFGILPVPGLDAKTWTESVSAMMPGMGGFYGMSAQLLATATLDRTQPGLTKDLADLIAPYGIGDVGGNWSRLYTGAALLLGADAEGAVPPWERFMHSDYREMMVHSAIDNSMRELVASGDPQYQPPSWDMLALGPDGKPDDKAVQQFYAEYKSFQERLLQDAEHLAGVKYMERSVLGMMLPISGNMTTEEQDSITAVWGMVYGDGLPEDVAANLRNPLVDQFKVAYPYADWWTIGKSEATSKRGAMSENLSDDMEALFSAGLRQIRSPEDYSVWAAGMGSYGNYRARRSALYAQYEDNPVDYLLNGSEVRDEIAKLDGSFQAYLATTDLWARKQHTMPFSEMLQRAEEEWFPSKPKDIVSGVARELTKQLTLVQGAIETGTYSDIRRDLFRLIDAEAETAKQTGDGVTMWDSIDKYYKKVADPYYSHLDGLWDKVNALPGESPLAAQYYQEIRDYTAKQKPRTVNGVKFPPPEVVAFSTKTPEEQRQQVTKWLTVMKPEWLTPFQQQQAGLAEGPPKKVETLTQFVADTEAEFARRFPSSYPETGEDDAREILDRVQMKKAQELGVYDVYRSWKAPTYRQLNQVLPKKEAGPGWAQAVSYADSTTESLRKAGYVADSSSPTAQPTQRWLFNRLNTLYKSDERFRGVIDNAGVALADDPERPLSRQDIFWRLFLDGWGDAPVGLI